MTENENEQPGESEAVQRFKKGLRQIHYEENLEESSFWLESLPEPESIAARAPRHRSIKRYLRPLAYATAASILAFAIALLWQTQISKPAPQVLAAAYYQDPGILLAKGGTGDASFSAGSSEYYQKKYVEAATYFHQITPDQTAYGKAQFMLGLIHLEQRKGALAVENFTAASAGTFGLEEIILGTPLNNHRVGADDLEWFLALSHLQAGNIKRSASILKNITAKEEHEYLAVAKALLKEL